MIGPASSVREQWNQFVRDLLNLFANVLFAVSLFGVWGLLTLIGVVVDQGRDPSDYFGAYPPAVARLILRMHFDNVYHSAQYVGIIGLILTSLAVCTFKRVIPARLPALRPVKIEHMPLHAAILVRGTYAAVRERIDRFFSERGWTIRKREFGGVEWSFADRHNWARRGVLVAHIGFVIIAAGTTIYWARGFSGTTTVLSGAAATIPQTGARLFLDRFTYRIDPITTKSGIVYQPIDYVSDVHVTGRDGQSRALTIRVNHPIDVDGTLVYQATYGFAVDFRVTKDGIPVPGIPTRPLEEGAGFALGDTGRAIRYHQFVGTIDRTNGGIAADPRPNDAGVVVDVFDGDQQLGSAIVPFGKSLDLGAGYRLTPLHYALYSGLQYRYDPGIPLVGIGAFVLLAGLCISLYLLPARLYVRIDPESGTSPSAPTRWRVGVAATTVKGYDVFEEQFRELVSALERDTRTAPAA
ncbi:MAG: cytochrome c biogenesis protein ResB [Candidatus Eremiobacteraeota bacterium]|nr:cytochrome c biogenesis protein ResB [Candidatus Eremiobacteraeota bacterium]